MKRKTKTALCIILLIIAAALVTSVIVIRNRDKKPDTDVPEITETAAPADPDKKEKGQENEDILPSLSSPSYTPAPSSTPSQVPLPSASATFPIPADHTDPSFDDVHPEPPPLTWLGEFTVPEWSGTPYAVINDNIPFFDLEDLRPYSYETYYALDNLGRCTLADAVIGPDLQPKEKRGDIGIVKPTGWHKDRYSFVNGEALYNRCHLIAYYLTAENANPWNLVTGTSYMNRDGMNDFENLVGDYIKETGNHVRYRVTPKWTGSNLICDGLLVEGYSIEDQGEDICFCIFAYNVQPGIHIDYLTGDNYSEIAEPTASPVGPVPTYSAVGDDVFGTFILNKKSMKFHRPDCDGAINMSAKNREEYTGSRNTLILDGYQPCPACNP